LKNFILHWQNHGTKNAMQQNKKLPPLFNESFAGYWSRTSFCDIEAFASVWKSK